MKLVFETVDEAIRHCVSKAVEHYVVTSTNPNIWANLAAAVITAQRLVETNPELLDDRLSSNEDQEFTLYALNNLINYVDYGMKILAAAEKTEEFQVHLKMVKKIHEK